jgi:ABC-2 type transport system permease protein
MSLSRTLVVFRQNARLLLGDPGPVVVFILTPLLTMAILKPTQDIVLVERGFPDTNGSEQVVPGFTVMFAFFWITFVGRTFFVEHGWGTWERLQTTAASAGEILFGKVLPAAVVILLQMVILFAAGSVVFDLNSQGPLPALLIVAVPLVACVLTLTLALVAVARTLTQVDAAGNLATMVFASLGGSLAPISVLPNWAETIAPATPNYWAVKATDAVILEGDGISATLGPAGVLLAFSTVFAIVAVLNFRFTASKAIA